MKQRYTVSEIGDSAHVIDTHADKRQWRNGRCVLCILEKDSAEVTARKVSAFLNSQASLGVSLEPAKATSASEA